MNESFLELWKEPLYRIILQITIVEIIILSLIMVGIVIVRRIRILQDERGEYYAKSLVEPLMAYLASDLTIEEYLEKTKIVPYKRAALELEKYSLILDGDSLVKLRELYEKLRLRDLGIKLCSSLLWWRRLEGARLLGAAGGEKTVEALMRAINDKYPAVRLAAVRALGQIRREETIEPLLVLLNKSEPMARRQIAQALISFGSDIHPYLKNLLIKGLTEGTDSHFLVTVIEILAITGATGSDKEITAALHSKNVELQIAAFKAAAMLQMLLPSDIITKGLKDENWAVRAQAANAAGKIRNRDILSALCVCMTDSSWWVRSNAGMAILSYGPEGIRNLKSIAETSKDRFARDMAMKILTSDPLYQVVDHGDIQPKGILIQD